MFKLFYCVIICVSFINVGLTQDFSLIKRMRECFTQDYTIVCLKERALDVINQTIFSDKPLNVYGLINIIKDPNFQANTTEDNNLPSDVNERNIKLNDMLYDKVEEFVESRSMKINLSDVFEGRGKKGGGGGKKGGMMMMGGLAMMGILAQMFMGKIAFMAGAALLIAKMALMLSAIIGIKKLSSGGGGGGESHIVYTSSSDSGGYGHGGGGSWHRSLDEDAQNLAYKAYVPENNYVQ